MPESKRVAEVIAACQQMPDIPEPQFSEIIRLLGETGNQPGFDREGRLKVAFFDAKQYDRQAFEGAEHEGIVAQFLPMALSAETAYAASGCKAVCIFVNDRCDAETVDKLAAQGVEIVALRCAGFNNVDLDACAGRGIDVVRVPAYSPYAVAEHTIGLMLMLNRRLHKAYIRNRAGNFVLEGLTGFDMRGKTVGVIGTGKIGQCVVRILSGFECRVLGYDLYPCDELKAVPGFAYSDLNTIYAESHIITLHVPLFPETKHLISSESIARMKDGVMLINTSRGGLVDTRALIDGLKSGDIGSAGLDVYEEEAGIFFHDFRDRVLTDDVLARLLSFNNVVVTSHQAFLTREALANIAATTIGNLREYVSGKRGADLSHSVPPQK